MTAVVRPAADTDLALLPAIARDAALTLAGVGGVRVEPTLRAPADFRRGLESGLLLVADIDGRAAGYALAWTVDGHAHLAELAVRRDARRRGLGRRLVAAVEDWARSGDRRCITVTTFRDLPWNAPFYAALGFREHAPGADEAELRRLAADAGVGGGNVPPRLLMRKLV